MEVINEIPEVRRSARSPVMPSKKRMLEEALDVDTPRPLTRSRIALEWEVATPLPVAALLAEMVDAEDAVEDADFAAFEEDDEEELEYDEGDAIKERGEGALSTAEDPAEEVGVVMPAGAELLEELEEAQAEEEEDDDEFVEADDDDEPDEEYEVDEVDEEEEAEEAEAEEEEEDEEEEVDVHEAVVKAVAEAAAAVEEDADDDEA